jgi:hypothetical protein
MTLAFSAVAMAQQYKWVDGNGKVQYGDTPPPGVQATPVRPPSGAAAQPAAKADKKGPLTPAEQEAEYRKRQLEAGKEREKQAQLAQEAEAKKENCSRAQQNLRTLESGQRIARTDAKGERYYLEDAQIAQETAKARQGVQQWCN